MAPQFISDPDRPDSAAYSKLVIVPTVSLDLEMNGEPAYQIAAPHEFHLVRGDAAVLRAGQVADSTRWYVHRWSDKSLPLFVRLRGEVAPARTMPASPSTWGSIKALYLL